MTQTLHKPRGRAGLYDYRILDKVKRYLKRYPDASVNEIMRNVNVTWLTAKRYKDHIQSNA